MDENEKRPPTIELPRSLWRCIASFLPVSIIESSKLYTLNRAFLEHYLIQKYHSTVLEYDERLEAFVSPQGHSEALSLPIFAGALKTLNLDLSENIAMTNVFTDFVGLVLARLCRKRRPPDVFAKLPERLALMKHLTVIEYTITSRNLDPILDFKKLFPLALSKAFRASQNTLTRLSLTLNMITLPKLSLAGMTFPKLREFEFCFNPHGCVGKPCFKKLKKSIQVDLIPFVRNHRETITKLSIAFKQGSADLGHHFLSNLPTFPSLCDLAIDLRLSRKYSTSGLHTLLYVHAKRIERFELQLGMENSECEFFPSHGSKGCQCFGYWWRSQPFMGIEFPRLVSLRCHFDRYDDHELLLGYLGRIASGVKILDLRPRTRGHASNPLRYEHLDTLTLGFIQHGITNRLERLHMECQDLAPKTLKLLAARLPFLKYLYLSFQRVTMLEPELPLLGTLHRDPVQRAYRVFAGAPCLYWDLRTLALEDEVQSHPSHKPTLCKAAMKMALPNLKTLRYLHHGVPISD